MLRISLALTLITATAGIAGAQTVYFEGSQIGYGADRPYTVKGVLMLPARDTIERIGGNLERNENGRHIHLTFWNNKVNYFQGNNFFMSNGKRVALPRPSEARNGVLYLPLQVFRTLTDGKLGTTPGNTRPGGHGTGRPDWAGGNWDWNGGKGGIQVFFDNRRIEFDGNEAMYRKGGTVMVPFRGMGDAIGAITDRTPDGKRVWINFRNNRVEYDKGHIWFRLNGQRNDLDTTSEDRGGVLFVPIDLFEAVTGNKVRVR